MTLGYSTGNNRRTVALQEHWTGVIMNDGLEMVKTGVRENN